MIKLFTEIKCTNKKKLYCKVTTVTVMCDMETISDLNFYDENILYKNFSVSYRNNKNDNNFIIK